MLKEEEAEIRKLIQSVNEMKADQVDTDLKISEARQIAKKEAQEKLQKKREAKVKQIPVKNQTFEEQTSIRKVLLTEAGGESASDYESDPDEVDSTRTPPKHEKQGDMFGEYAFRRDRIFKYITVLDKRIALPDRQDD